MGGTILLIDSVICLKPSQSTERGDTGRVDLFHYICGLLSNFVFIR